MSDKIVYDVHKLALGDSISFLSMLVNSDYDFHINVDVADHLFFSLKKIYKIPDTKLTVALVENLNDSIGFPYHQSATHLISSFSKISSPYLGYHLIDLKNETHIVNFNKTKKPCILLTCYQDKQHLKNFNRNATGWPDNRYHSVEEYSQLFKLIKQAGYEVMTLDNGFIDIEDKIYLLNEYCEAVIGYEGGLCHLAHTLKIPTIMLPWSSNSLVHPHSLHIDSRTYFLQNIEEILNWNESDLKNMIEELHDEKTNNIFYKGNVLFDSDLTRYWVYVDNKEYGAWSCLTDFEIKFFKENLNTQKIFGKPIQFKY